MALIVEGQTKCGLCGEIMVENDDITGLPASSSHQHPLYPFFDQGFHRACFEAWDRKEEVFDIIHRDQREHELSENYKKMREKYGSPPYELNKTNIAQKILTDYEAGVRTFVDLEIENESFANQKLEGIIFENCMLYVDFRNAILVNAQFINGHVKTSDFRNADLSGARIENVGLESTRFVGAKTNGLVFINNSCYGSTNLNIEDFERLFKNE